MPDMNFAVETRDLVKRYGKRRALDGLTLGVPRFAMLGLIGANGAGKTTWMMAVAGLLRLDAGSIDLLGSGPFRASAHRGRITLLPQDSALPLEGRPAELLTHYGRLQGLAAAEARRSAVAMLEAVHLGDRLDGSIRSLSHGMRKRVMIAQCFIGHPELVLLDEPLSGLDPREVARMRHFLLERRGRQTVVISSHNLHDIEQICDRVACVENGRAVRVAPIAEVTGSTRRLVYGLASPVADLAAVEAAAADAVLTLSEGGLRLVCCFDPLRETPEAINERVLPELLKQRCGVRVIMQGGSLEEAYLNGGVADPARG